MKRLLGVIVLMLLSATLFGQAVVTKEKKDISIMPVFSSAKAVRNDAFDPAYFDSKITALFNDLKRFNVIGYDLHFDNNTVGEFIRKVQEAKKQSTMKDPKYRDADLGVIVVPADVMEKLANSFFIVIPTISGFGIQEGEYLMGFPPETKYGYKAQVTISVRFIDAEGKLLDVYTQNGTGVAEDPMSAYKDAVDDAMLMMSKYVRGLEPFILKTTVLETSMFGVRLDLGRNMGVKTGYEYKIQRKGQGFAGFETEDDGGLLRVKAVNQEQSLASVIFGFPQVGDQLIEAPMAGLRFTPYLDAYLSINDGAGYIPSMGTNRVMITPALGVAFETEIGYDIVAEMRMALLFGRGAGVDAGWSEIVLMPFIAEIGASWEMYMGFLSLQFGFDVGITGCYFSFFYFGQNYTTYGVTDIIAKAKVMGNLQLAQDFKVRATLGYTVDINFANIYITGMGEKAGIVPYLGGPFISAEAVFRF